MQLEANRAAVALAAEQPGASIFADISLPRRSIGAVNLVYNVLSLHMGDSKAAAERLRREFSPGDGVTEWTCRLVDTATGEVFEGQAISRADAKEEAYWKRWITWQQAIEHGNILESTPSVEKMLQKAKQERGGHFQVAAAARMNSDEAVSIGAVSAAATTHADASSTGGEGMQVGHNRAAAARAAEEPGESILANIPLPRRSIGAVNLVYNVLQSHMGNSKAAAKRLRREFSPGDGVTRWTCRLVDTATGEVFEGQAISKADAKEEAYWKRWRSWLRAIEHGNTLKSTPSIVKMLQVAKQERRS
jgi:ribosomal protein L30/L7E